MSSETAVAPAIGPYTVVRRLGRGAMGEVFEVRKTGSDQHEALKLLGEVHSRDVTYRARFIREAQILSGIRHPNVVAVHARGEADHRLWLAMELVSGPDAAQLLKARGPMPLPVAADIIAGTAAALDHVWHAHRITHRDVKPGNILIELDGDRITAVKLADFGIAKHAQVASDLTKTSTALGTAPFISPEALQGLRLDGRSDMYSLGCTAFTLLTGRSPFAADTEAMVLNGHLERQPPTVTSLRPDLPRQLDRVLRRVLAKRPEDRYRTCAEFASALREVAWASPATAVVPPAVRVPAAAFAAPTRTERPSRKRALLAAGVTAAVALAGAGAVTAAALNDRPAHSPVTDLAQLMPPTETVSAAMRTTVRAEPAVTDSAGIGEPSGRSNPVKCSWFATGSLPRTSGSEYRSAVYPAGVGAGAMTVQVQLVRFSDSPAESVIDVAVNPAAQCPAITIFPSRDRGGVADFSGRWSVREVGPVAGLRTTVATNPAFRSSPDVAESRTFARAMGSDGTLTVSASATRTGGAISDEDALNLAGLVKTVLDRAAGR